MTLENIELSLEKTKNLLSGIKIPPRPTVIGELMREAALSQPNINKIANLISSDPAMSAAVLKVANSAFLGLKTKVLSIPLAVLLVGAKNICSIALGAQLNKLVTGNSEITKFFWKYSSEMALVSKYIAKKVNYINEDEAYLLGLFHEAGIILLSQKFKNYEEKYFEFLRDNSSYITENEETNFGATHSLVGALMAKMWELPDYLIKAIAIHHDKKDDILSSKMPYELVRLFSILKFSENIVCIYNNIPDFKEWELLKDLCFEVLEIRQNALKLAEECINLLESQDNNIYN